MQTQFSTDLLSISGRPIEAFMMSIVLSINSGQPRNCRLPYSPCELTFLSIDERTKETDEFALRKYFNAIIQFN
jgi:hypothetical protein